MTRIRCEVEHFTDGGPQGGAIVYIDDDAYHCLAPVQRARVDELLDGALADLAAAGCPDPETFLAVEFTQQRADRAAYQREADRRGVLAL